MYFLVYGENTHASRAHLASLRTRFMETRDASGMNVVRLQAKDADVERVAEEIFASPFLAERKMLVLEGFLGRPAAEQTRIKDLLERKPESTVVVFFEEGHDKGLAKSPLYPLLAKQKFTSEHPSMDGADRSRRIQDVCRKEKVKVSPGAVRMLSTAVGDDPWRLESELAKACAYAASHGGTLDEGTVQALVPGSQEESVFAFIDACLEGRGGEATRLLESLLATGMSEIQVAAMLLKQFRTLAAVRDLMDRGERSKEAIARTLGIHPFPAGKAMVIARRFAPGVLRRLHAQLLDIDRAMKTGSGRITVLLDMFTARLAAMR